MSSLKLDLVSLPVINCLESLTLHLSLSVPLKKSYLWISASFGRYQRSLIITFPFLSSVFEYSKTSAIQLVAKSTRARRTLRSLDLNSRCTSSLFLLRRGQVCYVCWWWSVLSFLGQGCTKHLCVPHLWGVLLRLFFGRCWCNIRLMACVCCFRLWIRGR